MAKKPTKELVKLAKRKRGIEPPPEMKIKLQELHAIESELEIHHKEYEEARNRREKHADALNQIGWENEGLRDFIKKEKKQLWKDYGDNTGALALTLYHFDEAMKDTSYTAQQKEIIRHIYEDRVARDDQEHIHTVGLARRRAKLLDELKIINEDYFLPDEEQREKDMVRVRELQEQIDEVKQTKKDYDVGQRKPNKKFEELLNVLNDPKSKKVSHKAREQFHRITKGKTKQTGYWALSNLLETAGEKLEPELKVLHANAHGAISETNMEAGYEDLISDLRRQQANHLENHGLLTFQQLTGKKLPPITKKKELEILERMEEE